MKNRSSIHLYGFKPSGGESLDNLSRPFAHSMICWHPLPIVAASVTRWVKLSSEYLNELR